MSYSIRSRGLELYNNYMRTKPNGAVYCYRSCLWACLQRAGGRAVSVTTITRNCMHRSSPIWVCRCRYSDHLQLIKFWRSCAPGKGAGGGAKISGSALLQPARSVCVSLSAFFPGMFRLYWVTIKVPVCTFEIWRRTSNMDDHSVKSLLRIYRP